MTTDSTFSAVTETPTQVPERRNLLQIILGILLKPRSTFEWLRDHGSWTWLVPLSLLIVLTLLNRVVATPIEQKQMEEALAQIQQQLEEQGGDGSATFFSGPVAIGGPNANAEQTNPATNLMFAYGLPIAEVVGTWFMAGLLLLVLSWLLGGRPSFGSMFRLSGWVLIPTIARLVVVIVVMLVTQRIPTPGLTRLMPAPEGAVTSSGESGGPQVVMIGPGGPAGGFQGPAFGDVFVGNLLSALDIYTVWTLILLIIGVTVTARFAWFKGLAATATYWTLTLALATLPILIAPLLGGLMGGGPVMMGP